MRQVVLASPTLSLEVLPEPFARIRARPAPMVRLNRPSGETTKETSLLPLRTGWELARMPGDRTRPPTGRVTPRFHRLTKHPVLTIADSHQVVVTLIWQWHRL